MFFLDTYALVEIGKKNLAYESIAKSPFHLCDIILCEFFGIILREYNPELAEQWVAKLSPYASPTPFPILLEAVKFRRKNRNLNLSFFDAVGYMHAVKNNGIFVTGDKAFENMPHVKYIK